jgi:hypothetical protein
MFPFRSRLVTIVGCLFFIPFAMIVYFWFAEIYRAQWKRLLFDGTNVYHVNGDGSRGATFDHVQLEDVKKRLPVQQSVHVFFHGDRMLPNVPVSVQKGVSWSLFTSIFSFFAAALVVMLFLTYIAQEDAQENASFRYYAMLAFLLSVLYISLIVLQSTNKMNYEVRTYMWPGAIMTLYMTHLAWMFYKWSRKTV